ncbi:MAG TPA: hypothetical protein DCP75_13240, partial [Haliea salexigens]|nr:hypothetical protein [Haliea salexigens]
MTSDMPEYLPLKVANALLPDAPALRAQMEQDGYLFLRGLLPPDVLHAVREDVTGVLQAIGWI